MRIMSYNTRGSLGMDEVRNTARIAETVRAYTPDVVCFQEIHKRLPWSGREDQPEVLGQLLGRRFVFQRNVRFGRGGYGIGIACRGEVVAIREHSLPGGREQRGALEVQLRNIGGFNRLTVFCTHWGLTDDERMQQAEALGAAIKNAPEPVVLCGDFNELPEAPSVLRLVQISGLIDAGDEQGVATFPAILPKARIDACLYSKGMRLTHFEVGNSLASDHLPLIADFEPR